MASAEHESITRVWGRSLHWGTVAKPTRFKTSREVDARMFCGSLFQAAGPAYQGRPQGFKNVRAQPVGSGASVKEMIRNIDNY